MGFIDSVISNADQWPRSGSDKQYINYINSTLKSLIFSKIWCTSIICYILMSNLVFTVDQTAPSIVMSHCNLLIVCFSFIVYV